MNILYLLHILQSNKIKDLVENIDLPPIDINLAVWDALDAKQIEVDEEKGTIKALVDYTESCDHDLADKILRVVRHYAAQSTNITRGTLNGVIKDPTSDKGYSWHDYLMALQWLIDTGAIVEDIVAVPAVKNKRPAHTFVCLGLPNNDNEEWNAREINKWIAQFEKKKVK